MKKFFSLVLALVMALSLTTVAFGAVLDTDVAKIGDTGYATLQAAIDAAVDGDTVVLLAACDEDIIITQKPDVDVILDGNDNTFTGTIEIYGQARHTGAETLTIQNINFTTDEQALDFIHCNTTEAAKRYAHNVTIQGCSFTATAANNDVVATRFRQCYNIQMIDCDVDGLHSAMWATGTITIVVDDLTATDCGEGGLSVGSSTSVTVKNSTIESDSAKGYGIRADGNVATTLKVENCEVEAFVPVVVRNTSTAYTVELSGNNDLTATNTDGYEVAIAKGTYEANGTLEQPDVSPVFVNTGSAVNTNASAVAGAGVTTDASGKLTGGTFATAPAAADVAAGYTVIQNTTGTYTVVPNNTGSTTAALYDLHQADAAGKEVKGDIGYVTVPAKVEALGNGRLAYIKMDGKLFVEIAAADATTADFYVTKANEKTPLFYMSQIDSVADVQYSAVATEYANIGIKCGELNVPYVMTVAELDFYAVTNPVNGKQTLFVEYDKTAASGTYAAVTAPYFNGVGFSTTKVQLLVDDEVVVAYQIGATDGAALALNAHAWSPVAYDKTTPVKAMCGLCGAEAVVYKTGKAPAGSVVYQSNFGNATGATYDLVITFAGGSYVPSVPSTDKVTSADTFDAGIAMYVGMSVMAAAGSAVVLKKRED